MFVNEAQQRRDMGLQEQMLVQTVGPLETALLAIIVVNFVTARAQRRREASETRESLAMELTECGNTLYFGLQAFWRSAKNVELAARSTAPELESAVLKLDELYQRHRITGKVLEQRLRIYYRDPAPAKNWHRAMSLLAARRFLLTEGNEEARVKIRQRNSGMDESGLSVEQLQDPNLIMRSYREALAETVESLWEYKVDRRGKGMRPMAAESPGSYQQIGE
jgi:hypothetical protein